LGKVVKGAHADGARYTVVVPEIKTKMEAADAAASEDDYGFSALGSQPPSFGAPAPVVAPPASVDFEAVKKQAEGIIDEAVADAEALLTDAHDRARAMINDVGGRVEQIAEAARRTATDAGHAAGKQAAEREMSELIATMRNLIEMTRAERHKAIESAEPELVKLALGIAERVLHQQISLDRNVVVEMAKAAISRLIDRDSITVRVNPADLERMREHREDVLALGDVKNVRIVEDQRVDRGGVVIETDAGSVDARVATQLAEVKKVLHIEDDVVLEHDRSLSAVGA
jgi:flagellar assembly protein FliH